LHFLTGLENATDQAGWTVRRLQERPSDPAPPGIITSVGCFSYARLSPGRIRIHFHNVEPPDMSPLSPERLDVRLHELRTLSLHAMETEAESSTVVGTSWLYNLPAYRRLFPAAYLESVTTAGPRFRSMTLWGQFLERDGSLREPSSLIFLDRLACPASLESLSSCFPLQPLSVEAPISDFLAFYQTR
jgi:hypothetical protein